MLKFFKKCLDILIATISTIILVGMIVFMLCGLFFGFSVIAIVIAICIVVCLIGLALDSDD